MCVMTGAQAKPIRYKGISHLAMVSADMDRTVRFWRDFLGMRLGAGLGSKTYRHYFLENTDFWAKPRPDAIQPDRTEYPGEGKVFAEIQAAKEPIP